jgi:uncharacterized protein
LPRHQGSALTGITEGVSAGAYLTVAGIRASLTTPRPRAKDLHSVSELLGVPIDGRLVVVFFAVAIAGLLRGFVGFGAALISVPVFSLVLGPHAAIAVNNVMGLPAVLQLLPEAVRRAERTVVLPTCMAIFIATPVGTWALVRIDQALMTVGIAVLVLLMVILLACGWRLKGNIGVSKLIAAGIAGGLVQGIAGVGGPPVVAVALSRPGEFSQQRANVLALMTAVSLSSILPLLYYGLFTRQTVVIGLLLVPVYSAATALGARYFALGGQKHYRRAALATLAAVGIATLIGALRNYLEG